MNIRSRISRRMKLAVAAIAAAAASFGIVATPATAAATPSPPEMTMCYDRTALGYDVYSRVENSSDVDLVHRRLVDGEIVQENIVGPGFTHVHVQRVSSDPGYVPTFASTVTDEVSGVENVFYYRNYHVPVVMPAC